MERGKKESLSPFPPPLWERACPERSRRVRKRGSSISEIITFVLIMPTRLERRTKENRKKGAQVKYKKVISCHFSEGSTGGGKAKIR
jgi:hypothetical protein